MSTPRHRLYDVDFGFNPLMPYFIRPQLISITITEILRL
jgi:hypothetical protein